MSSLAFNWPEQAPLVSHYWSTEFESGKQLCGQCRYFGVFLGFLPLPQFNLISPLIAIRPSDGDVKPGGPLGAFREEQAMSRHRVSPSPFLSLSSSLHTTQLHYPNSYTCSHPNFLQYTIQILVPYVMWSTQAVRELKIDHTQRHLAALRGTRST